MLWTEGKVDRCYGAICLREQTGGIWANSEASVSYWRRSCYANRRKIVTAPAWCLASGVVGVLAVLLQIVQMTFLAAVTVAIGWPLVFAKIVEIGSAPPAQQPTSEVKEK